MLGAVGTKKTTAVSEEKKSGSVLGDEGKADQETRGDSTDVVKGRKKQEARLQLG